MIQVIINYPDRNNVLTGKTLQFTEEFIRDDINGVVCIVESNLKMVVDSAIKDVWDKRGW